MSAAFALPDDHEPPIVVAASTTALSQARLSALTSPVVTRDFDRSLLTTSAPVSVGVRYTTAATLDVRTEPTDGSDVVTGLDRGTKLAITGVEDGDFAQVVYKGDLRWVTATYLSKKKPAELSDAPCSSGSAVERGLQPDTVKVHRAVCAAFSSITRYGGLRGSGSTHGTGRALDIMVSSDTGTDIAEFLKRNSKALGISQLIWRQRIWTVQRAGDGWRSMASRGSATANHYDHVHVTTYGNAGS